MSQAPCCVLGMVFVVLRLWSGAEELWSGDFLSTSFPNIIATVLHFLLTDSLGCLLSEEPSPLIWTSSTFYFCSVTVFSLPSPSSTLSLISGASLPYPDWFIHLCSWSVSPGPLSGAKVILINPLFCLCPWRSLTLLTSSLFLKCSPASETLVLLTWPLGFTPAGE